MGINGVVFLRDNKVLYFSGLITGEGKKCSSKGIILSLGTRECVCAVASAITLSLHRDLEFGMA